MEIKTETVVGMFILLALAIFFYMTLFLGVFRIGKSNYNEYTIQFDNVAGLEKKADVKIAGVKVGWVEEIMLESATATAHIRVHNAYVLRTDAQAIVRQDTFLSPKYLEVLPGNPNLPILLSHEHFKKQGVGPASIDAIMHNMEKISHNIEDITGSVKDNFGGPQGREQMNILLYNVQNAVERFAQFASNLDRTMNSNENNINVIITDLRETAHQIKCMMPGVNKVINDVSYNVSSRIESAAQSIEDAAQQVESGFKNVNSIAQKLDEGRGLLGKLINEDETYKDIRVAVGGLRKYFNKVENLNIVLDSHGEYMYRPAENVNFEDAKGYMDVRIHPNDDHFYVFQYVMSQKGNISRTVRQVKWFDENFNEIFPTQTFDPKTKTGFTPWLFGNIEERERRLDQGKFGAQFGKIYKDIALRVGIFENSAGFGIDFNIPFNTDRFRWVTTLEAFDFRGRDRFDDKRPHFKWLNRVFVLKNLYVAFGVDDFVSKLNANGFFGGGIRFCDEDLKYLISQISFR